LNFPDPVFLNRFAAARVVLILGMLHLLVLDLAVAWIIKKGTVMHTETRHMHHHPYSTWIEGFMQDDQTV
jgi:hypothetical protein